MKFNYFHESALEICSLKNLFSSFVGKIISVDKDNRHGTALISRNDLETTLDDFCKEIEDVKQAIRSKSEGRYEELQARYMAQEEMKKILEDKERQIQDLKQKIEKFSSDIEEKHRTIEELSEKVLDTTITDGLKEKINELDKMFLNKQQEASLNASQLHCAQKQLKELESIIESKDKTISELEFKAMEMKFGAPRISRMGIRHETNPFKASSVAMLELKNTTGQQANGIENSDLMKTENGQGNSFFNDPWEHLFQS